MSDSFVGLRGLEAAQGFGLPQSTDESFQFIVLLFIAGLEAGIRAADGTSIA